MTDSQHDPSPLLERLLAIAAPDLEKQTLEEVVADATHTLRVDHSAGSATSRCVALIAPTGAVIASWRADGADTAVAVDRADVVSVVQAFVASADETARRQAQRLERIGVLPTDEIPELLDWATSTAGSESTSGDEHRWKGWESFASGWQQRRSHGVVSARDLSSCTTVSDDLVVAEVAAAFIVDGAGAFWTMTSDAAATGSTVVSAADLGGFGAVIASMLDVAGMDGVETLRILTWPSG